MATKKEIKGFLIGTAAGAAIGAITALLFAPKPGKELRKDIADGAQQAYTTTAKAASQVGETVERITKQVSTQTSQIAGRAKSAASGLIESVSAWRGKQGGDHISASTASADSTNAAGVEAEAVGSEEATDVLETSAETSALDENVDASSEKEESKQLTSV